MKKFKKVIPALCMLLVSAIMLGSTTYAWFSMNNKVTANNMQVTATANTQFLVISNNTTLGSSISVDANKDKGGIGDGSNSVYPSARVESQTNIGGVTLYSGDWYTANSTKYDSAGSIDDSSLTNVQKVTEGDERYHISYSFYVGLAAGSTEYEDQLTFKPTEGYAPSEGAAAAVRAMIIVETKSGEDTTTEKHVFTNASDEWTTTGKVKLSNTTGVKVTVILFVDGTNSTVISNSSTTITGTVGFGVTAKNLSTGNSSGT